MDDDPMTVDPALQRLRTALEDLFSLAHIRSNKQFASCLNSRMMMHADELARLPAVREAMLDVTAQDVTAAARLSRILHREEEAGSNDALLIGVLPFSSLRSRCTVVAGCVHPGFSLDDVIAFLSEEVLFHTVEASRSATSPTSIHMTFGDEKSAKKALIELQQKSVGGHAVISRIRIFQSAPSGSWSDRESGRHQPTSASTGQAYSSNQRTPQSGTSTKLNVTGNSTPSVVVGVIPTSVPSPLQATQQQLAAMQQAAMAAQLMNPAAWPMMFNPFFAQASMLNAAAMMGGGMPASTMPPQVTSVRVTPNLSATAGSGGSAQGGSGMLLAPPAVTVNSHELHQPIKYRRNPYSRCSAVIQLGTPCDDGQPQRISISCRNRDGGLVPIDEAVVVDHTISGSTPSSVGGATPMTTSSSAEELHQSMSPPSQGSFNGGRRTAWQAHASSHSQHQSRPHMQHQQQQGAGRSRTPPLPKMEFPTLPSSQTPSSDGESAAVNSSSDSQNQQPPSSSLTFAQVAAQARAKQ